MNKKKIVITVATTMALVSNLALTRGGGTYALETVPKVTTTVSDDLSYRFTDPFFKEYVLHLCDTNGNGKLEQIEISRHGNMLTLDANGTYSAIIKQIKDLTGIELFSNLEYLNVWGILKTD